jgi:hypothetical protein
MHPPSAYHTVLSGPPDLPIAARVIEQTFRTRFDEPGFSLLSFAIPVASENLRAAMLELKQCLHTLFLVWTGRHLVYQSMARFDQQTTTKFHLDGGPPESFLMLGYEPSEVASAIAMADYSLAAWKMGIEPAEFVADYNPMYATGAKLLEGTITPLAFDARQANILVVNNSCLPFDASAKNLLGVMHQATIAHSDPTKRRIINSTMIRTAPRLVDEALTPEQQQDYVTTMQISGPTAY